MCVNFNINILLVVLRLGFKYQRFIIDINIIFEIIKNKIEFLALKFLWVSFIIVFRIYILKIFMIDGYRLRRSESDILLISLFRIIIELKAFFILIEKITIFSIIWIVFIIF